MFMVDKRIILITGATRGLGLACAEVLVLSGHQVIALGRTVGALEELSDRLQDEKGSVSLVVADVTNEGQIKATCRNIHDRFGRIDVWIHTAIHATPLSPSNQLDKKLLEKAMEVNFFATQSLISNLSYLLDKSSRVVFFSDQRVGEKFFGAYGASKQAQISLAQSWKKENYNNGPQIIIFNTRRMATRTTRIFTPGLHESSLISANSEAKRLLTELNLVVSTKI